MVRHKQGTWYKVIRAEELVEIVKAEIAIYRETQPYRLAGQFDDEGTTYICNIEAREEPPARLPIIIGEWAHNLRSALDHLAWELVEANGGVPGLGGREGTQFPIHLHEPEGGLVVRAEEGGVHKGALALIELAQPYDTVKRIGGDPRWHKLAILQEINNCDKHRTLLLGKPFLTRGGVAIDVGPAVLTQTFEGRFYNKAEVARFDLSGHIEDYGAITAENVKMDSYGSLFVSFNEPRPPGSTEVVEVLTEVTAYAVGAIEYISGAAGLWKRI